MSVHAWNIGGRSKAKREAVHGVVVQVPTEVKEYQHDGSCPSKSPLSRLHRSEGRTFVERLMVEEDMKIGDLPLEQLETILSVCEHHKLSCKDILEFDIEELEPYIRAAVQDRDARIEVRRKWLALTDELDGLIDPICTEYPNLEFEQQIEHLRGPDRARADAINRELLEMVDAPVITRFGKVGMEKWKRKFKISCLV